MTKLIKQRKTLEQAIAAKPTADLDEKAGGEALARRAARGGQTVVSREAASDAQALARDPMGLIGGEEHCDGSHVSGLAQTSERLSPGALFDR